MNTFESTIKHERLKRGWSQRRVAELARVGFRTYQRYESGARAMPKAVQELLIQELGLDAWVARDGE